MAMKGKFVRKANGMDKGDISKSREKTPDRVWNRPESNNIQQTQTKNQICIVYKLKTLQSGETYAEKIYFDPEDETDQDLNGESSPKLYTNDSDTQQSHSFSEYRGNFKPSYSFKKSDRTMMPKYTRNIEKPGQNGNQQRYRLNSDTGGNHFRRIQCENKDKKGEQNKSQEKRLGFSPGNDKNMISPLEGLYPAGNDRPTGRGYGVQRYKNFAVEDATKITRNEEETGNESPNETTNTNKKKRNMSAIIKEDWDCPEETTSSSMNDKDTDHEVEKESDFLKKPTRLDELYKNLTLEPEKNQSSREQTINKNNNDRHTTRTVIPKKSFKYNKNSKTTSRKVEEDMVSPNPTKDGNKTDTNVNYKTGGNLSSSKGTIEIQKIYKVEKVWDIVTEAENVNKNDTNLSPELETNRNSPSPATNKNINSDGKTSSQTEELQDSVDERAMNDRALVRYLEEEWDAREWTSLLYNQNQNVSDNVEINSYSLKPSTSSEQTNFDCHDEYTKHSNTSDGSTEETREELQKISYADYSMEDINADENPHEEFESNIKIDENSNSISREEMNLKICESPYEAENTNYNFDYQDEEEKVNDNNSSFISNVDHVSNSSEPSSNIKDNREDIFTSRRENETDSAENDDEEMLNTKSEKFEQKRRYKRKIRKNKGGNQKKLMGGRSSTARFYPTRNRTRKEKIFSNSINYYGNSDDEGETDGTSRRCKRRKTKHKTEVEKLREGLHIMFTSIRRRAKRAQKARFLSRKCEDDDLNIRRKRGRKRCCILRNCQNDGQASNSEHDKGQKGPYNLRKSKSDTQNSDESCTTTGSEDDSGTDHESSESEPESDDQNSDIEHKGDHKSPYYLRKPKNDERISYVGQRKVRKSRYNLRKPKSCTQNSNFEQRNAETGSCATTESENDSDNDQRSTESEADSDEQESDTNQRSAEAEPENDEQESNADSNANTEEQSASNEAEARPTGLHGTRLSVSNDTNPGEERNLRHVDDYETSNIRPVVVLEKLDLNNFVQDRVTAKDHVRPTRSKGKNKETSVRRNKRPSKTCSRGQVYLKRNVRKFKKLEYRMIKRRYVGKKLTEATEHLPLKKIQRKRKVKNDKGIKEKQARSRVKRAPVKNTGTAIRQSIEWLKCYGLLNYSFVKSQVEYSCKLCPVTTENITAHYKLAHRGSEVMISRLNRKEASEAVAGAIAEGIAGEVENNSGQVSLPSCVYNCRMCNIHRMTRFQEFFVHITTHTGEYTWACLVEGCHVTAPTNEEMEIHIRNEHPNHDFSISAGKVEPFTNVTDCGPLYGFICSGCNFVQVFRKNVEDHIKKQHKANKNISIIKINLSSKETSQQTNDFEQFGSTSDERENLRETRQNEDCVIIQNDVTVEYPTEQREEDNKTSPLIPVQGNAPEVVELDLDEEPDVQSRMENDFDIKVEREIGPFTRRKWVVGYLQAQMLDDSGLLYDCLIKTCLFTTRVYSNFESHVRIIHSKTKWRGDCDSCDHQGGADDNLTLINALEHLIPHTRQVLTGNRGMINENSLPRTGLDSNEQEPHEEEPKDNSDQNNQTTESNPPLLVQQESLGIQDPSDGQTSNLNNLTVSETQEGNVSIRTEDKDKCYYLVEQSNIGDGSVFRIQQIQELSPVCATTQEVTKKIVPLLRVRIGDDETEKTGMESTNELETNSELKLSIPTSVITSPNENLEPNNSSGEFEDRNENTERESPENESGLDADVSKPSPTTQKPSLNTWNPILSNNNTMKHDNKTDNTLLLANKPRRKKKKFKSELTGKNLREYGSTTCSLSNPDIFILKNHKSACFYAHKCGPVLCPHCIRGFCDERCFVIRQPPHGVKQYFCNLCTFRSPVKASMNKHMNSKHKSMRMKTSSEAKALPNTDHSYSAPNSVDTNQYPPAPYQALINTNQDRSVLQQILPNTNQDHSVFHQILPNTNQDHPVPHLILPSTTQDRSVFQQVLTLTNQDFAVPPQISPKIIQDFPVAHHIPPDTSQDLPVHHQILANTNQDLPIHVQILPGTIQDRPVFHQVLPHTNQDFPVPHQIPPNITEDFSLPHHIPPNTNQDLPVFHQIIPSTNQDHSVPHLIIPNTIQDPSVLHQIALNSHQEFPVHHQIPPNTIEDPAVLHQIPLNNNQDFSVPHQIIPNIDQDCSVFHQIIPNPNQEFQIFHQIPPNTIEDFSVPHQIPPSTIEDFSATHQIPNINQEPNTFFQHPFDINQEFDGVNPNPLKADQDPLNPNHHSHEPIQGSDTKLESSNEDKQCSSKMNDKAKSGNMRHTPSDTAQESSVSPKVYCCPLCKTRFKAKKKVLYERHLSEEARCRQFKYKVAKPKPNDKNSIEEHSSDTDTNELRL